MLSITTIKNELIRSSHNFLSSRTDSEYHFLFITTDNLVSQSQIYPFFHFKRELLSGTSATFSEVNLNKYLYQGWRPRRKPNLIFFQPWFNNSTENLRRSLGSIKKEYPEAKIAFLDSYAPLDLRFAEAVNSLVDVYVKKHVFRDRSKYGHLTIGETNLSDHYGKLYDLDLPKTQFNIPAGFLNKLIVGPSFELSKRILPFTQSPLPPEPKNRTIDVHARLGGMGGGWYGCMRKQAIQTVSHLNGLTVQAGSNVNYRQYIKEMRNSKMCFSPFGFGEVCWRDFESIISGALLIKPEMDHAETYAPIFRPFETYVPVKWDFSDLEEKVRIYLNNDSKRIEITRNAYTTLQQSVLATHFVSFVDTVMRTTALR